MCTNGVLFTGLSLYNKIIKYLPAIQNTSLMYYVALIRFVKCLIFVNCIF